MLPPLKRGPVTRRQRSRASPPVPLTGPTRSPLRWRLWVCLLLLAAGCQTPSAAGPADSFGLDFSMPKDATVNGALVFFVDGVSAEVFAQMLEANELPAFKKYFVDRGLYCPRAVASIPAVTLPNETSIVTGLFPGHHGVAGVRWFDRNQLVYRNYATVAQKNMPDGDYTAATIYEQFPDRLTFSVFFQVHRGATDFGENRIYGAASYFMGWFEYMDRMTLGDLRQVAEAARAARQFPAFTICYLLAPDFHAYQFGMTDGRYRHALRHADRQIGRVLGDVERAGLLDKITIALVSDHGVIECPRHFPLKDFLSRAAGLDVSDAELWENTPFLSRQAAYGRSSAVTACCGNEFFAVHLRRPIRREGRPAPIASGDSTGRAPARAGTGFEPWIERPTSEDLRSYPARGGASVDLPKLLCEQEAVDAVAYAAGAGRVRVRRRDGEVEFRQEGGRGADISYAVIEGNDPLQWRGKLPADALAGKAFAPRRWLEMTIDTEFPDLPAQIPAYFRSRRAGDLAVFAAPGWDFVIENKSGHGGLRPGSMFVPLLLAGPGVPKGRLDCVRTVDLCPTLLKLLGRPVPPGLDGQPLLSP